jgi:hypothetical protein
MHSHGLYKHSVVRSCQLFFKIYIFTAHIVQKHLLKAMRVLLEAVRMILEAVRVLARKVECLQRL